MMYQDPKLELQDIRRYSQYIIEDTTGMDIDSYLANRVIRFSVERCLIVIGETAAHLRSDNPETYQKIDSLHLAIGIRNRLAHGYDDLISNEAIWATVQTSTPKLIKDIDAILK